MVRASAHVHRVGGKSIGQGLPMMQDTVNMILKLEQEGRSRDVVLVMAGP